MLRQKPPVIFIIQNNDLWRYWVVTVLCQAGAQVESFSTAAEAFKHLEDNALPDLVLVDAHTPDLASTRFASVFEDVRSSTCWDIPVISVSASENPVDAAQVIANTGARGFLKLPCPEALLLNLADMLLHGSRPSGQPLVLVADDSPAIRKVLMSNLSFRGYKTLEALDGAQTVQLAQETNPDVIILDHILPDGLGLAVMPRLNIKALSCVIVITGDPTPSLAEEYSRLGAHAFIRKPFNVGYVLDMIDKVVGLHSLQPVETPSLDPSPDLDVRLERYEDLFQKFPLGTAVFKAIEDGFDFAVVALNNAAEVLLGFRHDSGAEDRLSQTLPSSLDSGLQDSMRHVLRKGKAEFFSFAGCSDARCANFGVCHVLPLLSGEVALVFGKPPGADAAVRARSSP